MWSRGHRRGRNDKTTGRVLQCPGESTAGRRFRLFPEPTIGPISDVPLQSALVERPSRLTHFELGVRRRELESSRRGVVLQPRRIAARHVRQIAHNAVGRDDTRTGRHHGEYAHNSAVTCSLEWCESRITRDCFAGIERGYETFSTVAAAMESPSIISMRCESRCFA